MAIMQFMDRAAPLALDPAIALLGNEEQGLAIDWPAMRVFIRDRVTAANNWLGDPNAKLTYASPSAKWIWNAFGVLSSGTTLRCDHDPASLDSSVTPLNSLGIGAGAVVNKSIVLANGTFTYPVGEVVRITDAADITKWILGRVVSWTAGTKTLVVAGYAASATYLSGSNWKVIVALGIRVESQRTNLLTNSEFPNGLSDAPTRSNVTASGFPRLPSNTGLAFPANSAEAYAYKSNVSLVEGSSYTLSVFVQMDDGLGPPVLSGAATGNATDFALIVQGGSINPSSTVVEDLGNNLYRVWGVRVATTSSGGFGIVRYAGNRQRAFRVSGYVCELGTFPSSYIPTTSAQVTRAADKISLLTSQFAHNPVEWTVYGRVRSPTNSGTAAIFYEMDDNTTANRTLIYRSSSVSVRSLSAVAGSSVFVGNSSSGSAADLGFAQRVKDGDTKSAVNGALSTVGTALAGIPVVNRFWFGGRALSSEEILNGHIKSLVYLPRGLIDSDLQLKSAA